MRVVRRAAVSFLVAGTVLGGCVPAGGTAGSRELANVWTVFTWAGIGVAGLVAVLSTWAVLRYRRAGDALPPQVGGNVPLEVTWTIVPLVIVLGLFWFSLASFGVADPAPAGSGDVRLQVTAFRWGWQFIYPDAGVTITSEPGIVPEIVLPVDTAVHVSLTARDVDHAFYVPNFLFKRDAIPGRVTDFDLHIEQQATYAGVCAEYCGVLHDQMPFSIRAVPLEEYRSWVDGLATPTASPGAAQ